MSGLAPEIDHSPSSSPGNLHHGFFNFDHDQLELSRQGWIYLACTFLLTFVVLGASFGSIRWTGRRKRSLLINKSPIRKRLGADLDKKLFEDIVRIEGHMPRC